VLETGLSFFEITEEGDRVIAGVTEMVELASRSKV
jgi:hypothetical protein